MNDRLRLLRESFGLSRAAFGAKLGVSGDVINNLERGRVDVKDPMIKLICREFDVDEHWLRTGDGDMLIPKTRSSEIAAFVGDILHDDSNFQQKFISVLARMTTEEWELLERKVLELAEEIKKADP